MVRRLSEPQDFDCEELDDAQLFAELCMAAGSEKHRAYYQALQQEYQKRLAESEEFVMSDDGLGLIGPTERIPGQDGLERPVEVPEEPEILDPEQKRFFEMLTSGGRRL